MKHQEKYVENLGNVMLCAEWIVGQLEALECYSIANIFQGAIDDSHAWIQNIAVNQNMSSEEQKVLYAREADLVRSLLVCYAKGNAEVKKRIFSKIIDVLEEEEE